MNDYDYPRQKLFGFVLADHEISYAFLIVDPIENIDHIKSCL